MSFFNPCAQRLSCERNLIFFHSAQIFPLFTLSFFNLIKHRMQCVSRNEDYPVGQRGASRHRAYSSYLNEEASLDGHLSGSRHRANSSYLDEEDSRDARRGSDSRERSSHDGRLSGSRHRANSSYLDEEDCRNARRRNDSRERSSHERGKACKPRAARWDSVSRLFIIPGWSVIIFVTFFYSLIVTLITNIVP